MDASRIKSVIRRCLNEAGDLVKEAELIQKTYAAHSSGEAPSYSVQHFPVRVLQGKNPVGRGSLETGPVLDRRFHVLFIESPAATPEVDDEIIHEGARLTILNQVPADNGAGLFYEVWCQ